MAGRDNHDKEMLRTLKRIATALEKIAQNTGPKNRTIEIDMESNIIANSSMIERLNAEAESLAFGNDGGGDSE